LRRALLPAAACLALLCGCAGREHIYFRPTGDTILYSYTYYPEQLLVIPPDSQPTAGAAVAAGGVVVNEDGTPTLVVNVRIAINNPTDWPIEVRRGEQRIATHAAAGMTADRTEADFVIIQPGRKVVVRLQFRPGAGPPFEETLSFVYTFRYRMYKQAWPEDVEFARIMPGEIIPPPIWDGVMIIRF